MPKPLLIGDFLSKTGQIPLIDVRSPGEFAQGHMPGAVNIPLFSNEERAEVGTIYKQLGKNKAVFRGLDIISQKLEGFIESAKKMGVNELLVNCWRGGMRSGSMAWLFEKEGMYCSILVGGYKSYRREVLRSFELPTNIFVVGGETGSGKTEILHELKKLGEQIIDLEAIAHHKGSSYGAIGQLPQPTTEQFENELHAEWMKLDHSKRIWIEDESRSIGKIFIPPGLWQKKISSPILRIKVPFEIRVKRLVDDYGNFPKQELYEATERIKKRLGGQATTEALDSLMNGDLSETVRITLKYYDKAYDFPQSERKYENVKFVDTDSGDPSVNAKLILDQLKK